MERSCIWYSSFPNFIVFILVLGFSHFAIPFWVHTQLSPRLLHLGFEHKQEHHAGCAEVFFAHGKAEDLHVSCFPNLMENHWYSEGFPRCPLLWAFHMDPISLWEIRDTRVWIYHIQSCSGCYSTYQRIKQSGLRAFFPIWNGCFVILILLLVLRRDYLITYLSQYGGTLLEEQSVC